MKRTLSSLAARYLVLGLLPMVQVSALPRAASEPELGRIDIPELLYAFQPLNKHPHKIDRRIHGIIHPTIGFPALAIRGSVLKVLVRASASPTWRALLRTRIPYPGKRGRFLGDGIDQAHALPFLGSKKLAGEPKVQELRFHLPLTLPRETFHLELRSADRRIFRQPRAVRIVARQNRNFRFVIFADNQLKDPSAFFAQGDRNTQSYPGSGQKDRIKAIALQGNSEVGFLDPEFALHMGDLVYGVDYRLEYPEAWDMMAEKHFSMFAIPGNHDGYALYDLKFSGTVFDVIRGGINCRKHLGENITPTQAFRFLSCIFGDLSPHLFSNPLADGLQYWRRMIGPTHFAFEYGGFRFIALNTYDGTPQRRHAYVFSLGFLNLTFDVPSVDNYGGYLRMGQLGWARRQMAEAKKAGKKIVLIAHHDFRGNREQEPRYHANLGFPTNPFGVGSFEEWNFDSALWDSDKNDQRGVEGERNHSGIALCRLVAEYADYVLLGHRHGDENSVYKKGEEICPGVKAGKQVNVVRTTTASSSPHSGGNYWGYRVVEVREGKIKGFDYLPERGLGSLPSGNFWASRRRRDEYQVMNYLPTTVRGVLRFDLPPSAVGYRITDEAGKVYIPREVVLSGAGHFSYVELGIPPGISNLEEKSISPRSMRLKALTARGNRPPFPVITAPSVVEIDSTVRFSAEKSRDPDGDQLMQFLWRQDKDYFARGPSAARTYSSAGRKLIELTVHDQNGVPATVRRAVMVALPVLSLPQWPAFRAPPTKVQSRSSSTLIIWGLLIGLLITMAVLFLNWQLRREKKE